MQQDTKSFVTTCPVCVYSKSLNSPPAGLLNPLMIPCCPWSHVAVDFVTGLPDGKITILTEVNHFSKAVHNIPLLKLSSAIETGDLLVRHVFHLHRFTRDMVLERTPSSPHRS